MAGISDALFSSADHLRGLGRALAIIQGNVGNASTPGYARQDLVSNESITAAAGLQQQSSRNNYAEQAVRRQNALLGRYDQASSVLRLVEPTFGISGDAEIPKAISNLFATFSGLTASPNDTRSRQLVLDRAAQLGRAFNSAAKTLQNIEGESRSQVTASVDSINRLAALVRDFNVRRADNVAIASDPAVDARLYETLEHISEFADVQALRQSDGSLTLLLGGQTALVVGERFFPIQADLTSGPLVAIRDSTGADVTSHVTSGRLSGALTAVNQQLPSYQNGLDQLARGIADAVNAALGSGVDINGAPGAPLFTYQPPNIAATLATTGITTAQLAAATPAAPGGNGNALILSGLETKPTINGLTFAGFYGNLAAVVGRDVADASDNRSVQQQLLAQARSQRSESQGVSLDEEAVRLIEYQRAYQATAKMVTVLQQLTETTINMIR
jgi:flagellar hook-associated protein 1 FlgK